MQIPFLSFSPANKQIKTEILTAFETFFDAEYYVLGNCIKKFEDEYAAFNNVKYCVGISNGLDALYIALKTLGIGTDDEVIVPSNTYIATVLAILYAGAKPVFVEPRVETCNIDPELIEAAITSKTRAIMPVHLYGQACEMSVIMAIAQKHNLYVIEDNAQAQGAAYENKLTGCWGHINATSFYPTKNLGALGDAGAITTDDEQLAQQATLLRNYGSSKKYYNEVIGYNKRLDECQAAFLSVKLKYLDTWTKQRQEIAGWYNEGLKNIQGISIPVVAKNASHVYHLYVIQTPQRDKLQAHLKENGVGTLIHFPIPPHLQEACTYMGYKIGDFPVAEKIANNCLSLPLWPGMTKEQVGEVCAIVQKFSSAIF